MCALQRSLMMECLWVDRTLGIVLLGGLCFPRVAWMQAFLGLGRKGTFDKLYVNHFLRSWGSVLFKADAHML